MLLRDLIVVRKHLTETMTRTIMQPLLLVFVFTYVFPKIGQGVGGAGRAAIFSTLLVAGVVALSIVFQGIQSVALPLVQELSDAMEIEDRLLAPMPVSMVAVEKVVAGAIHSLVAGAIVFPIAVFIPATPVHLDVSWPVLLSIAPLACVTSAALGLTLGTLFDPRTVPLLFGFVVLPLTFLGAIYYPWADLDAIAWLQYAVLVNPVVYMSEGLRAALVSDVAHMPLPAVYGALVCMAALFIVVGIGQFKKRVLS